MLEDGIMTQCVSSLVQRSRAVIENMKQSFVITAQLPFSLISFSPSLQVFEGG